MAARPPLPTLGYPTQNAAIIALHEAGNEPRAIAEQTGAPLNSVHRAIHNYRVKTGRIIRVDRVKPAAAPLPPEPWNDDAHQRRLAAYRKAVMGARNTLEAAGL